MMSKINYRKNSFLPYLVLILVVGLTAPFVASADVLGQVIGKLIFWVLFSPFIALLEVELIILPIIAQFSDFINMSGVAVGWKAMRDLSNMFFIVVLLVMSFATILKIQTYGYKQLLKNLIIMAILINFSKLIVGIVVDFFQIIMLTFVDAWKNVAAGNITSALGIDTLVSLNKESGLSGLEIDGQIILAYLLAAIMVALAAVVVMAFILTLVMRIIFLWILVVLAPLAFVANTFPDTKKYFQTWLSALSKEIIIGPVLAFFLWLSFTIVGQTGKEDIINNFAGADSTKQGAQTGENSLINVASLGVSEAGKADNILKYIVGLAMLFGSLKVAQQIGASSAVMGMDWGKKMGSGVGSLYRKTGNLAWKGTTGEGGAQGALRRATTPIVGGALKNIGSGLKIQGIKRAGMSLNQMERDRQTRKQAKMEEATKGMTSEERRLYFAGSPTKYSGRALDKLDLEEGKLSKKSTNEVLAMVDRAKAVNDTDTLTKLQNSHAMANTESSIQDALDTDKGKERYAKMSMKGTFDEDENGNVIAARDKNSQAYQQGQMLAKGFLQLESKEQDEVLKSMDKESKEAILAYVKTLSTDDLETIDETNDTKAYVVKQKEVQEAVLDANGNQVEVDGVAQFQTVTKTEQEINEDSVVWRQAALLGKYKSGEANTGAVYQAAVQHAEERARTEVGDQFAFKADSADKALAKTMTGSDLAKMNPGSSMFKSIAQYLSLSQMRAMSDEGNTAGQMQVAVNIKLDAAQQKIQEGREQGGLLGEAKLRDGQAEIRRLKTNLITKPYAGVAPNPEDEEEPIQEEV